MTMSEKDLRLAAEKGMKVDANTQNQIMEDAINRTKARVAELNAMKAEEAARKQAEEEAANAPMMSKRQRIEMLRQAEQAKQDQTMDNPDKLDALSYSVKEDLNALKKPALNKELFKPFAHAQSKTRVEEVPSMGLSYPTGYEIYITPYSGDDIDELSNSNLSLKYVLTKCLEGVYCNFDKNMLTFYDCLYLSWYRRILSFGPNDNKIQIAAPCPHCGKYSTRVVDLKDEIEFEDLQIPSLPINVDFSFGRLSFTFLTYKDFMNLQTELRSEELAYQCITECDIDTEHGEVREQELQKLFGSLVGEDAQLLRQVRQLTYHGIKPLTTLCQNKDCGETFEAILDEMSSIILPFRSSQQDLRSKVSFG